MYSTPLICPFLSTCDLSCTSLELSLLCFFKALSYPILLSLRGHLKKQYAAWTTLPFLVMQSTCPLICNYLPSHWDYIYMESSKQKMLIQFSVREQRRKPAPHKQSALHRPPSQSIRNERLHPTAPSCISLMIITVIVQNNAAQSNFWIYLAS